MKKVLIITLLMMVIISIYSIAEELLSRQEFVRVTSIEGKAIIRHGFNESDEEVFMNSIMTEGDTIETYDRTRLEAMLDGGIIIRVNENTRVHFLALNSNYDSNIILRLEYGDFIIDSSISNMRVNNLRVDAVDCSVYLVQEGVFRVVSAQLTDIMVYSGGVEVASQNNSFSLRAGQRIFNVGNSNSAVEYFNTFANDDFSRWSEYRQGYYRTKRVPREYANNVSPYDMIELQDYGAWRYESGFGYVWVPHVTVEWRPYLYGHWVWFPWGWSWVSYEPWGWAPYHYGRWNYSVSIGWFWIPRPVFGLSWVYWYDWDDYVGWCPLDYYDRPLFFGTVVNNYYYRPHPKSWTVIPKNRLGYRELYRYRMDNFDNAKPLLIDKHKLIRTNEFKYKPQNIPSLKSDWKYGSPNYKEFFKKPLDKNESGQESIRRYDKSDKPIYPRTVPDTSSTNKNEQFREFQQKLDKYRTIPEFQQREDSYSTSPQRDKLDKYNQNEEWRNNRSYDKKEIAPYPMPYRKYNENNAEPKDYEYKNYYNYRRTYPNEEDVPKNYYPDIKEPEGNIIKPYYWYEAKRFMENKQREQEGKTPVPSKTEKTYERDSNQKYKSQPSRPSNNSGYNKPNSRPSSKTHSSPQRKKP